ncbi:hypothetical protein C8029_18715 [Roseobacter sp. TSBP12]|nr:hypothetical protein C8029_18715 [Roseobacter sp. TSBP12]
MHRFHRFPLHTKPPSQHQTARPPHGWRGLGLQPPLAASVPVGPAAQPLGGVQGGSALADMLLAT